jgi:hypothetical protein
LPTPFAPTMVVSLPIAAPSEIFWGQGDQKEPAPEKLF